MLLLKIIKNKYLLQFIFSICISFYSFYKISNGKNTLFHFSLITTIIIYWKNISYKNNN